MKKCKSLVLIILVLFISFVSCNNIDARSKTTKKFEFSGTFVVDGGSSVGANFVSGGVYSQYYAGKYSVDVDGGGKVDAYCLDPELNSPTRVHVYRVLGESKDLYATDMAILNIVGYKNGTDREAISIAIRMFMNYHGYQNAMVSAYYRDSLATAAAVAERSCGHGVPSDLVQGGSGLSFSDSGLKKRVFDAYCSGVQRMKEAQNGTYKMPDVSVKKVAYLRDETNPDAYDYVLKITFTNFDRSKPGTFKLDSSVSGSGFSTSRIVGASTKFAKNKFQTYESGDIPIGCLTGSLDLYNESVCPLKPNKNTGNVTVYVGIQLTGVSSCDDVHGSIGYEFTHPDYKYGALLKSDAGDMDSSVFQRFASFGENPDDTVSIDCEGPCPTAIGRDGVPAVCESNMEPDDDGNVTYKFQEGFFEEDDDYNIKKCIINNEDVIGNKYKLVDNAHAKLLTSNPYCSVYCKEDYVFNMPYIRNTANGRYFNIGMKLAGSQKCYSSKFDREQFYSDLQNDQIAIISAYNEYKFYNTLATTTPTQKEPYEYYTNECNINSYNILCCDRWETINVLGVPIPYCAHYLDHPETINETPHYDAGYYGEINIGTGYYSYSAPSDTYTVSASLGGFSSDYANGASDSSLSGNIVRFGGSNHGGDEEYEEYKQNFCGTSSCLGENKHEFTDYMDDYNSMLPTYQTKAQNALDKMASATEKLKKDIDKFNSCPGSGIASQAGSGSLTWQAIYTFNPLIKYTYNEPNSPDFDCAHGRKWIEEARDISITYNNGYAGDVMIPGNLKVYQESCADFSNTNYTGSCETKSSVNSLDFTDIKNDAIGVNSSISTTIPVRSFCTSDPSNNYSCSDETTSASVSSYGGIWIANGSSISTTSFNIVDNNYVKTAATAYGEYDTAKVYYTNSDSGEVVIAAGEDDVKVKQNAADNENPDNFNKKNFSIVDGLPVSIKTPLGQYYYKIILDNIGKYYSENRLGRIYGEDESSLSTLRDSDQIKTYDACDDELNIGMEDLNQNEYACTYDVGPTPCVPGDPECDDTDTPKMCVEKPEGYCVCDDIKCEGEDLAKVCQHKDAEGRKNALSEVGCADNQTCDANYNCCPYCKITCVGTCIFDSRNWSSNSSALAHLLDFRAINTASVNPNQRTLGFNYDPANYNWSSASVNNALVAQKAGITINEIESRATVTSISGVSDDEVEKLNSSDVSITLTPEVANWVRDYNKDNESNGSYNNETLDCKDYKLKSYTSESACTDRGFTWYLNSAGTSGYCSMKNIMCYSTFLDLIKDKFDEEVDLGTRPSTHIGYDGTSGLSTYSISSGPGGKNLTTGTSLNKVYKVHNYWGIFVYDSLDTNGDGVPDIGPSWN